MRKAATTGIQGNDPEVVAASHQHEGTVYQPRNGLLIRHIDDDYYNRDFDFLSISFRHLVTFSSVIRSAWV